MNVVDSSGWLEYFANGSNADFFAPAITDEPNLVGADDLHVRSLQTAQPAAGKRISPAGNWDIISRVIGGGE